MFGRVLSDRRESGGFPPVLSVQKREEKLFLTSVFANWIGTALFKKIFTVNVGNCLIETVKERIQKNYQSFTLLHLQITHVVIYNAL